MSSGTSSGDEKKDAGKWAWASTENKCGKASATANKFTASATATPPSASATATASLTASVDVGASLKVNVSAQFSINVLTWNLTYLSMQTAQIALTCRGAKVEANASKATVDGNTNKLTTLKNAATALHNNTKGVEMKNEQLLSRISALNLNS